MEPLARVAVLGATGYSGQELVRLLARHPAVQRAAVAPAGRTDAEALFSSVPGAVIAATEFRLLGVPGGRVLASNDSASVGAYATEEPYFTAGRDSSFTQRIHESVGQGRPALMQTLLRRRPRDEYGGA